MQLWQRCSPFGWSWYPADACDTFGAAQARLAGKVAPRTANANVPCLNNERRDSFGNGLWGASSIVRLLRLAGVRECVTHNYVK